MGNRDYDKELDELKKEAKNIIGEEELDNIMEIVNLSYQLDDKSKYEINYKTIN